MGNKWPQNEFFSFLFYLNERKNYRTFTCVCSSRWQKGLRIAINPVKTANVVVSIWIAT